MCTISPQHSNFRWDDDDEDNWSFEEWKQSTIGIQAPAISELGPLQMAASSSEEPDYEITASTTTLEEDLAPSTPSTHPETYPNLDPDAYFVAAPKMCWRRIAESNGELCTHAEGYTRTWNALKYAIGKRPKHQTYASLIPSHLGQMMVREEEEEEIALPTAEESVGENKIAAHEECLEEQAAELSQDSKGHDDHMVEEPDTKAADVEDSSDADDDVSSDAQAATELSCAMSDKTQAVSNIKFEPNCSLSCKPRPWSYVADSRTYC